jgi:hypothetical protein
MCYRLPKSDRVFGNSYTSSYIGQFHGGIGGVSMYNTLVFGLIALIILSVLDVFTKLASTLKREKSCSKIPLAGP